ncbi:hypothetical protein RNJ44_00791 [Nakaseomyces bracarensis]|uniref:Uncharacterized protein n=1 Tax=Nakaseomyces bracarensis TaxID=273131 RepID=A0ABR4NS92_9SACH
MSSPDEQELIFEDDISQEIELMTTNDIEVNPLLRSPLMNPVDHVQVNIQSIASAMAKSGDTPLERIQKGYDIPRSYSYSDCMYPFSSIVEHMAETNYKLWLHSKT